MEHTNRKQLLRGICTGFLCVAMCVSFAAGCAHGDPGQTQAPAPQATEPTPQTDASALQTTQPASQTTEPAPADPEEQQQSCDALFYGDSITAGNNFDEIFPQLRIVDFGLNGATIEYLTGRVPEVSAWHPAKIFVMAGGNNLYSDNIEECVELYRGLLDALCEACPNAEIFVESMLPCDKFLAIRMDCPNGVICKFNRRLAELAAEYGMTYLDIYPVYEYQGGLPKEMSKDGIHLNDDAFGPWAEVLRPYLEP